MSLADVPLGRRTLLTLLLGAPVAMVAVWWLVAVTGAPDSLFLAALALPLLVLVVPLALIAREVGSQPDDPEEVESRLAASLGLSKPEFDELYEDRKNDWK